jgi:hypothetical protein
MSRVLGPLKGTIADNLLDDITVKGQSRKKDETLLPNGSRAFMWQHIQDVKEVLQRLIEANLTVSAEKALFGADHAVVIGHKITSLGRSADPKRLGKITGWSRPKTISQLRGFLALISGCQMYIKHTAEILEPLTAGTRGHSKSKPTDPIQWNEEMERSFLKVKEAVRKASNLKAISDDPDLPLYVYTDAGDYGVGAVLMQPETATGNLYPVRFESKLFNPSQRGYSVPRKELLAVHYALIKLRPYLHGRKFILRLDSSTVAGMIKNPGSVPDPMLVRWLGHIHSFHFDIQKIPRTENILADALGRLESESDTEQEGPTEEAPIEKFSALSCQIKEISWMETCRRRGIDERIRILFG